MIMSLRVLLFLVSTTLFTSFSVFSQDWFRPMEHRKVFVENKGQFDDQQSIEIGAIKFAADFGETRVFFGEKGVQYSFLECKKIPREEREAMASKSKVTNHKEWEKLVGKFFFRSDKVNMTFVGGNAPKIEGVNPTSDYHSYSFSDGNGGTKNVNNVRGFEKIVYKNVYPKIDIEYTVHPQIGIKYAIVLHPGADATNIKFLFDKNIRLENGKIKIATLFGDIIDHEPITFYEQADSATIPSSFEQTGERVMQFKLGNYNKKSKVIIDPWTQTPNFNTNWDIVWEVEKDGAGNVYVLGGIMPMQVLKYNTTGALQWTYNTPYDTSNVWLGTFATDLNGNTYITAGSTAKIQKINSSAALQWDNPNAAPALSNNEFWTIAFNCDQTQLLVGGAGGSGLTIRASVYTINTNTGGINSTQNLALGSTAGIPPTVQEIRAITASPNGKYYYLTQDTLGSFHSNFNLCSSNNSQMFKISSTYAFGYKSENFRYQNSGISAIRANNSFFYTQNGTNVHKRNLLTGAIVASAVIPAGNATTSLGKFQVSNSGIDLDDCGNVYVGTTNGVVKYDANLTQLATYSTAFKVYDVIVLPNGDIAACGGSGNSSNATRTGGVQVFAASACAPLAANCCDATICPVQNLCSTDAPVTLTAATPGGTWSGPGMSANGTFNPATAGPGNHTITYTLPCGSGTVTIIVSPCQQLSVCQESNGSLTVSNGVAPYTWATYQAATSTPITNQAQCTACGYTWFGFQCVNGLTPVTTCNSPATWVTYTTGTNATPPSYPIRITDASGTQLTLNSATGIQPCNTTQCPTITLTANVSNVSCFNGTNGSATISATSGTAPYTYTWSPGNLSGATQTTLAAGTYTINLTDANLCPGTTTITITQPTQITGSSLNILPASCGQNDGSAQVSASGGTGNLSYSWSPTGGNAAAATGLGAGNYVVTVQDANQCQTTINVTVPSNGGPTITNTVVGNADCLNANSGTITVSASGGTGSLNYSLNNGTPQSSGTFTGLSAGNYTVTVSDANNCSATATVTLTAPTPIQLAQGTILPASCGQNNGSATVIVNNGSGNYSYTWTPTGGTTATASGLAPGSYSVNVVDNGNGCTASLAFTITAVGGPDISITAQNNPTCFNGTNGSVVVSATGGTAPYTYQANSGTPQASNTLNGLGAGNYTITVYDANQCSSLLNITLIQPTQLNALPGTTATICAGQSAPLTASGSGGVGPYTYDWSNGLTGNNPTVTPSTTTTYTLSVTDANNCLATSTVVITVVPIPTASASPVSVTGTEPFSVTFTNTSSNATSYVWDFGNGSSQTVNTTASISNTYLAAGTYTVVLTASAGSCSSTWNGTVIVTPKIIFEIFVPNVFSPNGDGNNDEYGVITTNAASQQAIIVNRWGNKMVELNEPNKLWDGTVNGKEAAEGVYFMKYKVVGLEGTEKEGHIFFHLERN
ncbi:MAG: hypothetical protein RL264_507 [Bacteroidota bacterium]|jgi:gliding motility-associated-like protein